MKNNTTLSTVACPNCNTRINIGRKIGQLRESGHIKDMYCSSCGKFTPHIENPADKIESYWILKDIHNINKFLKYVRIYNVNENAILFPEEELELINSVFEEDEEFDSTIFIDEIEKGDAYNIVALRHPRGKDTLIRKTHRFIYAENDELSKSLSDNSASAVSKVGYEEFKKLVLELTFDDIVVYCPEVEKISYIESGSFNYEFSPSELRKYKFTFNVSSQLENRASTDEVKSGLNSQEIEDSKINRKVGVKVDGVLNRELMGFRIINNKLVLIIE